MVTLPWNPLNIDSMVRLVLQGSSLEDLQLGPGEASSLTSSPPYWRLGVLEENRMFPGQLFNQEYRPTLPGDLSSLLGI